MACYLQVLDKVAFDRGEVLDVARVVEEEQGALLGRQMSEYLLAGGGKVVAAAKAANAAAAAGAANGGTASSTAVGEQAFVELAQTAVQHVELVVLALDRPVGRHRSRFWPCLCLLLLLLLMLPLVPDLDDEDVAGLVGLVDELLDVVYADLQLVEVDHVVGARVRILLVFFLLARIPVVVVVVVVGICFVVALAIVVHVGRFDLADEHELLVARADARLVSSSRWQVAVDSGHHRISSFVLLFVQVGVGRRQQHRTALTRRCLCC